jgi:hypothetical protein
MSQQLFIAVSTGQNVANVMPIIEFANPGDRVLWIESPFARQSQWRKGADKVLEKHALIIERAVEIEDLNNPRSLADELQPILESKKNETDKFYIIANGGYKFTPIGLGLAFQNAGIDKVSFLYSLNKPVKIIEIQNNSWEISDHYYQKTAALADIIMVRDKVMFDSAKCLWEWGKGRITDPGEGLPLELDELENLLIKRELIKKRVEIKPRITWDQFKKEMIDASDIDRFYEKTFSFYKKYDLESYQELADFIVGKLNQYFQFQYKGILVDIDLMKKSEGFAKALKKIEKMQKRKRNAEMTGVHIIKAIIKANNLLAAKDNKHSQRNYIGAAFENSVADAVVRWAESKDFKQQSISQIWQNVKIAPDIDSGKEAELDVVLLLANGIVIHLECKSYGATQKDLDARITTLHAASSILSEMYVVFPKFTAFANTEWFRRMQEKQANHFSSRRYYRSISYTHPGQPLEYDIIEDDQTKTVKIPAFEETLDKLFKSFEE